MLKPGDTEKRVELAPLVTHGDGLCYVLCSSCNGAAICHCSLTELS